MKKHFGFTLAEVLITLGIIGVVSIMTLPSIKMRYEKKVAEAQLKHSYSTLQNAIRLSEYHNGKIKRWGFNMPGSDFFHKYLQNYLKYTNEYHKTDMQNMNIKRKLLNGREYTGSTFGGDYHGNSYTFLLLNGAMVTFNWNSPDDGGLWVGIDINGFDPPNMIGRDSFIFFLSPEYGLQPLGGDGTPKKYGWNYGEYNRDKVMNSQYSAACSKNATPRDGGRNSEAGYWCAALIMHDGWKIEKDYPWGRIYK